jgi:hypothetical protein
MTETAFPADTVSRTPGSALGSVALAAVLHAVRPALDLTVKSWRRFLRQGEPAVLQLASERLAQSNQALNGLALAAAAPLWHALLSLAQRFAEQPATCTEAAVNQAERATLALINFMEEALKDKPVTSIGLFAPYREVQELVGAQRVHPADLWPESAKAWQWTPITWPLPEPLTAPAWVPDEALRARVASSVLKVIKTGDAEAAQSLRDICLQWALTQRQAPLQIFWKLAAAFFEASALGLCPATVYSKRATSQLFHLLRAALAEPATAPLAPLAPSSVADSTWEPLARDLLFFCALAKPQVASDSVLSAVRAAYGLSQSQGFDFEMPRFGRSDLALLVQTRRRLADARASWANLDSDGSLRFMHAQEHMDLLAQSLLQLHPASGDLAYALKQAADSAARSRQLPSAVMVQEVSAALLYLQVAHEGLEPQAGPLAERSSRLAARITQVSTSGTSEPLDWWLENVDAMDLPADAASAAPSERAPNTLREPGDDEQLKIIGSLRISIHIYNIFLNEADEWSRQLLVELSEWALELHRPVFESTAALAGSLHSASRSVGFHDLSGMAKALQQALQHLLPQARVTPVQAQLFVDAAEDIRRLLHQFAAGFLKEPDQQLRGALLAIPDMDFPLVALTQAPVAPVPRFMTQPVVVPPILLQAAPEDAFSLLMQLRGALRQWSARPDNLSARKEGLRILRALEDRALMLRSPTLRQLIQRLEDDIEQLGTESLAMDQLGFLTADFEAIQMAFEQLDTKADGQL